MQDERPQEQDREMIDNPEFVHWEDFKEGSWVLFKDTYNLEGQQHKVLEVRQELKTVEDEQLVLEIKVGAPNISSPNVKVLTKTIPHEIADDKHEYELKEVGTEEVKIAGRTFDCRIFEKRYIGTKTPGEQKPVEPLPGEKQPGEMPDEQNPDQQNPDQQNPDQQQPGQDLPEQGKQPGEQQDPMITDEQLRDKTFIRMYVCEDVPGGIVRMLWLPLEGHQPTPERQPGMEQPEQDRPLDQPNQDQPNQDQPEQPQEPGMEPKQDFSKALKTRELVSLFDGETPERP
jgi:hypothetical protein